MSGNKTNKNYKSRNHSKFILTYHIIFVCKYRKKLLIRYGEDIKQTMYNISKRYDFTIKEMEVDKDHIHMMVESIPKISPLQIVRVLKQQSTIQMWRKYSKKLKKHYWSENTFWTDGYFVSTIGEVSSNTLKHYIRNQGLNSITSSILQLRNLHMLSIVPNDTYSFFDILARVAALKPTDFLNWVFVISLSNNNLNNGL